MIPAEQAVAAAAAGYAAALDTREDAYQAGGIQAIAKDAAPNDPAKQARAAAKCQALQQETAAEGAA
jgi:hypothetical protein